MFLYSCILKNIKILFFCLDISNKDKIRHNKVIFLTFSL